jgi:glutamine amidotransferase PdxT
MTFRQFGRQDQSGEKAMELKMSVAVDRSRGKMRPVFIQASHVISPLLFI